MDINVFTNADTGQIIAVRGEISIAAHATPENHMDWARKMFGIFDQNPANLAACKLISKSNDELKPNEEAPQPGPNMPPPLTEDDKILGPQ